MTPPVNSIDGLETNGCFYHLDHANRIERCERDVSDLSKLHKQDQVQNAEERTRIHERIDHMQYWVIAGMAALIVQASVMIVNLVNDEDKKPKASAIVKNTEVCVTNKENASSID